jgi:uncharacterized protein (TIGR00730 family)
VVLPGGFGTFDELFEALTLVQTRTIVRFPIVLVGHAYWDGLMEWLKGVVAQDGKISATDMDLILVTDSIEEAVEHVIAGAPPTEPIPVADGM